MVIAHKDAITLLVTPILTFPHQWGGDFWNRLLVVDVFGGFMRGVSPEAVAGMRALASQYLRRWDSCPE